jgi:hypothetical protein
MPAGRPSEYDPQVAADICHQVSITTQSLEAICNAHDAFPSSRTFYRWLLDREDLRQLYARARDAQLQILADQIVPLADTDRICEKITIKADGSREVVVLDQVERSKLQIDSRKWLLSKLAPQKYGDKQQLTGPDGGPIQIVSTIPRPPKE